MYGYNREAVRVKVKKCEMNCPPEWRKFSVDPQITSVEILHSILAKAFDIRSDFSISYRTFDPLGHETFLAVISDWDLDAAFLRTHNYSVQTGSEPCLNLRVDVKSFLESSNFEGNSAESNKQEQSSLQQSIDAGQKYVQNMQNKLPGLIMNQMEKTFSMVQRALNFAEEQIPVYPPRTPLSDSEFRSFLDSVGQIIRPQELRHVVFLGGIDPSLRKVVWKHILNVYPNGMTGRERMDYMKRKAAEYYKMREVWNSAAQKGSLDSELAYVTSMVKKDVLRTDRLHQFYAGSDDNQNILSLFNILTTFALNHPKVSYCQGMSDLASPLLVTMNDEAHAYICFCAVMERLQANFMLDGISMTQKFSHLTEALQYYDSEFYEYLKLQQADDLLFCYRWLLLELKREFPFEDSLRMLEVQWSSLRSDPPDTELKLFDKEFVPQAEIRLCKQNPLVTTDIQRKQRENHYANICALRRQTSSSSLFPSVSTNQAILYNFQDETNSTKLDNFKRLNHSLDENITRIPLKHTNLMKAHQSLDESKMLFLMRNISPTEHFPNSFGTFSNADDKKSSKNQNSSCDIKNCENKKIIFHSTNPFINDAKGGSTEILICDDKIAQRNFEHIQANIEDTLLNKNGNSNSVDELRKRNCLAKPENLIAVQIMSKHKGHFKELKEKITASKKGILASIDKIESHLDLKNVPLNQNTNQVESFQPYCGKHSSVKNQKVVKNLNEFLNFANKTKTPDKLIQISTSSLKSNGFDLKKSNDTNIVTKQEFSHSLDNKEVKTKKTTQRPEETVCVLDFELDAETKFKNLKNGVSQADLQATCNEFVKTFSNVQIKAHDEKINFVPGLLKKEFQTNAKKENKEPDTINYERLDKVSSDIYKEEVSLIDINKRTSTSSSNNADVYIWENPLHQISRNSTCSLNDIDINENGIKSNLNSSENFSQNNAGQAYVNRLNSPDSELQQYDGHGIEINLERTQQDLHQKQVTIKSISNINAEKEKIEFLSLNPFLNEFHKETSYDINQGINGDNEIIANNYKISNDNFKIADSYTSELSNYDAEGNSNKSSVSAHHKTTSFLPPPNEFGGGNPFLIFLCLTLLLQHRNIIMRNNLDYNEMAMHFDKMVRKHDVNRVLNQARRMYFEYLKTYNALENAATATENFKNDSNNLERKW